MKCAARISTLLDDLHGAEKSDGVHVCTRSLVFTLDYRLVRVLRLAVRILIGAHAVRVTDAYMYHRSELNVLW